MTVYVIQSPVTFRNDKVVPAFDFTLAERYGEVRIVLPNDHRILEAPEVTSSRLIEQLRDFDPVYDYIIPVGDHGVGFLVGMMLGRLYGFVRILRWIPKVKAYQPITFDIRS